jgi:hypothetical protein
MRTPIIGRSFLQSLFFSSFFFRLASVMQQPFCVLRLFSFYLPAPNDEQTTVWFAFVATP